MQNLKSWITHSSPQESHWPKQRCLQIQFRWLTGYCSPRCLPLSLNNLQVSLADAMYGLPYNAVEQCQSKTYIWNMRKSQYTNFDVSISGRTRKHGEGRISGTTYLLKYSAILWRIPTKHDAQHARHASTAKGSIQHSSHMVHGRWNSRWPSAFALFCAAFSISLTRSKRVTIKEPNAIDPREKDDARPNADNVGCLGYGHRSEDCKFVSR